MLKKILMVTLTLSSAYALGNESNADKIKALAAEMNQLNDQASDLVMKMVELNNSDPYTPEVQAQIDEIQNKYADIEREVEQKDAEIRQLMSQHG